MSNLMFWDNGNDTVIAESAEDAAKVWEETTGESWEDYLSQEDAEEDDQVKWEERKPQSITLFLEDEDDALEIAPKGAEITPSKDGSWWKVTASSQQWIDKLGRCFFSSENW